MPETIRYAPLADIVNGFEYAKTWRFVRKGMNNWSLIGLDDDTRVVYEIEHLHFMQVQGLMEGVKHDAEIVTIQVPHSTVRKGPVVRLLMACLYHMTGGKCGEDCGGRDTAVTSLQGLLDELKR